MALIKRCGLLTSVLVVVFMVCSFGPGEIEGLVCYNCTGWECGDLKTTGVEACNETNPVCIIGSEATGEVDVKMCMEKSNAEEFKKKAAKEFVICNTDKCNFHIGLGNERRSANWPRGVPPPPGMKDPQAGDEKGNSTSTGKGSKDPKKSGVSKLDANIGLLTGLLLLLGFSLLFMTSKSDHGPAKLRLVSGCSTDY